MWKAVLAKNKQEYDAANVVLIGSEVDGMRDTAEARAKELNDVKVKPFNKPPFITTISGHLNGYWLVVWDTQIQNEFGPVSP